MDQRTLGGEPSSSGRSARSSAVQACWRGAKEPPPASALTPGQFAWRSWYDKGGGLKGNLAGAKKFVDFMRQTWTAALCTSGQGPRLFVARYFFDDSAFAEAYKAHETSDLPGPGVS